MLIWLGVLASAWAVTAVTLLASNKLMRLIGPRGLRAVEKLMGMLLIMIAIQMLLDGIAEYTAAPKPG